jgi:hypothetical protein
METDMGNGALLRVSHRIQPGIISTMNHVVLLGDSIFDNAAYVHGSSDVITHLKSIQPQDWKATLLAVDGSISTDVIGQIRKIPESATHLIVSAGGNDGLSRADILQRPATSVASADVVLGNCNVPVTGAYELVKIAAATTAAAALPNTTVDG